MRSFSNLITLIFCALFAAASYYVFLPQPSFRDRPHLNCEAIRDVSLRPLGDADFNGKVEHQMSDSFHDVYLHAQEGAAKVALREEWGGALVFVGAEHNLLSAPTAEKALQLALHDDTRAFQGCAANESCLQKSAGDHCSLPGWNPLQATDTLTSQNPLDGLSELGGLVATVTPLQYNPHWQSADCTIHLENAHKIKANVRITQSLRFIKSNILEIEYMVTNLANREFTANLGPRHELPRLFTDLALSEIAHVSPEEEGKKRLPASRERSVRYLHATDGWLSLNSPDQSLGLYWENRRGSLTLDQTPGEQNFLKSNFPFGVAAMENVRARFYLLLGNPSQVTTLAETLDRELPPFGRIDESQISPDTRHVHLSGWVLDNKKVQKVELWVDNKKTTDVALSETREDICRTYPGYAMCEGQKQVGYDFEFARPRGGSCDVPIEIRATDDDGNTRVVARKAILPLAQRR